MPHRRHPLSLAVAAALALGVGSRAQQQLLVEEVSMPVLGEFHTTVTGDPDFYYILWSGGTPDTLDTASDMALGIAAPQVELVARFGVAARRGFSRVQRISIDSPRDTDRDGIDDVYELLQADILDPLNPADAQTDPDGDGRTHFEDYLVFLADPTTVTGTSPAQGETGVAVTRETVLRLGRPLAEGSVVTGDQLFASLGGQTIPAYIHLSDDRQRLTLFYQQSLPAQSRVTVSFETDGLTDYLGLGIDGNGDGNAGGVFQLEFETLALNEIPGTAVCGRVFASEFGEGPMGEPLNTPLAGVTITVDGRAKELSAVTDAMGNFRLDPSPAGRFFVHIDGATASGAPPGGYYPTVGKAWNAPAGVETNVGNVHLPLVVDGTLQPTSANAPTEVGFPPSVLAAFPEFAEVQITVPPNALLSPDGSRGGSIGIAPVPSDRLPGTLPPGLNFPLVITVQTDGATNFDEPVPVCFPNLPDPVSGVLPAPGESALLYSFDHDTGEWGIVGTGTVSEDGTLICSDPGSGIVAPGWHAFIRCVKLYRQAGRTIFEAISEAIRVGCDPPPEPREPDPCEEGIDECMANCEKALRAEVDRALAALTAHAKICDLRFPDNNNAWHACVAREIEKFASSIGATLDETEQCLTDCVTNCIPGTPITCLDGIDACVRRCEAELDQRLAAVDRALERRRAMCLLANEIDDNQELLQICLDGAQAWHTRNRDLALQFASQCINLCAAACEEKNGRAPSPPLDPQPRRTPRGGGPSPPDSLRDSVRQLFAEHFRLLSSVNTEPEEPELSAMRAEAEELLEQADQIAGGDALGFLDATVRADEQSLIDSGTWPGRGNPPENPILFVANLESPSGDYVLRGATGPFGRHELVVPDNARIISLVYFDPPTRRISVIHPFRSPIYETILPEVYLIPLEQDARDTDDDGLPDIVEPVYGTDPDNPDTDGDGIIDGGEIELGTNPLDGLPAATGLIASVDTPGTARDIWADNNLAAIADDTGVSVFNIFNGMAPVLVAQIETPGSARRVAGSGTLLAVADHDAGLAIIDLGGLPAGALIHQIPFPSNVTAVAAQDGTAFAGLEDGGIAMVEMARGIVLGFLDGIGVAVQDLLAVEAQLYALSTGSVFTFEPFSGSTAPLGSVASPRPGPQNFRLAPGGDILYAVHGKGYNTFDLADPANPTLIAATNSAEFGWRDFADGGSGIGVATVGPNSALNGNGSHNVRSYDVGDPAVTNVHLGTFETPGDALSVAIHNGIAYAVDFDRGLRVVNYLSYDSLGMPPSLAVGASFDIHNSPALELGARAVIRAELIDDVHVRNVEFHLDGERVWTDAYFPFEFRFTVPPPAIEGAPLVLDVVASDTGGNRSTQSFAIDVLPDTTPPTVVSFTPPAGSLRGPGTSLLVHFSEPMDATAAQTALSLVDAMGNSVAFVLDALGDSGTLAFTPIAPLAVASYTASLAIEATDLAGNPLNQPLVWDFEIYDVANDSDGDCLPDDLEIALGLDPGLADSDNNGILDGDEDHDADGIINCREIVLGADPASVDSDDDGIEDGAELVAGTDILVADTDGDGFLDGEEVEFESDPLEAGSVPVAATDALSHAVGAAVGLHNNALPSITPLTTGVSPVIGVENEAKSE